MSSMRFYGTAVIDGGEQVSIRLTTDTAEHFGVALVTDLTVEGERARTRLVGNGPLGRRRKRP